MCSLLGLAYDIGKCTVRTAGQTNLDRRFGLVIFFSGESFLHRPHFSMLTHHFLCSVCYCSSVLADGLHLKHYFWVISPWSRLGCIDCAKWKCILLLYCSTYSKQGSIDLAATLNMLSKILHLNWTVDLISLCRNIMCSVIELLSVCAIRLIWSPKVHLMSFNYLCHMPGNYWLSKSSLPSLLPQMTTVNKCKQTAVERLRLWDII